MSDYNQLKNAAILNPTTNTDLGSDANRFSNVYMSGNIIMSNGVTITSTNVITPKISSVSYLGSATATNPAGGEIVTINGSGFASGASTYVAGAIVSVTNFVNSNQLTFIAPAQTAGSYTLVVVNSDGGTASYIPGLTYSLLPVWSTTAGSLGSSGAGSAISTINLSASENAQSISYAITSGSLPTGLSLSTGGAITGTPSGSAATYNFTVTATDPQGQTASRNFSYTITIPFMAATGGTVTTSGNYKIHTFTSSGTFTVTTAPANSTVEYLIIAGGGGAGHRYPGFQGEAGAGGAGGALTNSTSVTQQAYTVTVGAGGTGYSAGERGNSGTSSSIFSITAYPGGGGGGSQASGMQTATSGTWGSGGGGGKGGGGSAGTSGQGYNGSGAGAFNTGAGGGAGGSPTSYTPTGSYNIDGGIGITSSISGSAVNYAGGGGGAGNADSGMPGGNADLGTPVVRRAGGLYGGGIGSGAGGAPYNGSYAAGLSNTGGGGGANSGSGGSGVVIIRYQYQ